MTAYLIGAVVGLMLGGLAGFVAGALIVRQGDGWEVE